MKPRVLLIGIVAAGLALRLFDLGGESLWLDEGVAIRIASMPLIETVSATMDDVHPPLYRSLLHGWIQLFGRSETATRLLSALLGTLAVWLAGLVGMRICGPFVGLAAAALLAVSPLAVRYAQDATSYSLFLSLTLGSQILFLRWLSTRHLRDGIAYALVTAGLLYSHNAAWFVIAAQWITLLVALRRAPAPRGEFFLRWVFLQCSVAALYVPWLSVLPGQLGRVRHDFWTVAPSWRALGGTLLDYAGSPWMLVVLGLACAAGLLVARLHPEDEPAEAWPSPRAILLPWLLVPIAGPFVASYVVAPIFLTRITLPALPAFFLLVTRGVARLRSTGARATCAALLLLGTAFPLISNYREPNKERWREAAADLDAWASPGDLLIVHSGYCKVEVLDYYLRRRDLDVVPFPNGHSAVSDSDMAELRSWIAGRRRVWLLQSHSTDGRGLIRATLTAALPWVTERDYPQVGYRWSPGPPYIGVALWQFQADSVPPDTLHSLEPPHR